MGVSARGLLLRSATKYHSHNMLSRMHNKRHHSAITRFMFIVALEF